MKYKELPDGWFSPIKNNFRVICCDCSLCHDIDFRIKDNQIQIRVKRNNRSTALARRKK